MSLNYVTLVLDVYDGQGNPVTTGKAMFTPSARLADAGVEWIPQVPVPCVFHAAGTPSVTLLATDNSAPLPAGWVWSASFTGVPGNPAPFSFFLPFSGGATQYLSALVPVANASTFSAYVPLSALGLAPSGDVTGATDRANIQALLNLGGQALLAPGQFYTNSTLTITSRFTYLKGAGRWATQINFTGTGDCLRVYNTDTTGILTGGGLLDFTINGTSAGAGSAGLHYGDQRAGELRIAVQDFSGAGSVNVHFDNQYAWTEETTGYLWLSNGTQNLVFDVSGNNTATNSFGYTDLQVEILAKANQDGVVCQNGALLYNSRLLARANFQGSSSVQSNAVLRITGTVPAGHPNAGSSSAVHSCRLDIVAECSSGTGSNVPQTIVFGTLGGNTLLGCTGIMDFAQGQQAFATSNYTALGATGTFSFQGVVRGDFNLNNATVGTGSAYSFMTQGTQVYGKSLLNVNNGSMTVDQGDFFSATLTGSITVSLNPGGGATLGGAQRKTIIIKQAAAGGPYTVAWPHTGSPTTTSCSVVWAGGSAPTMSAGASAVDVYYLDTYDGATWYGRATQNVS